MTETSPIAIAGVSRKELLAQIALGSLFTLVIALLLAPCSGLSPSLPGEDRLDEVAQRSIAATHDFDFERQDPDGLNAKVRQARDDVDAIWSYNPRLRLGITQRIETAFRDSREALHQAGVAKYQAKTDATANSDDDAPGASDGAANHAGTEAASEADADHNGEAPESDTENAVELSREEALALLSLAERIQIVEQLPSIQELQATSLDPARISLEAFAADGFSRQAQDALKNLVDEAMRHRLVDEQTMLPFPDGQWIMLRFIDAEGELISRLEDAPNPERSQVSRDDWGALSNIDALISLAQHHLNYVDDPALKESILSAARALIVANTWSNMRETREAQNEAAREAGHAWRAQMTTRYRTGETLVPAGSKITREMLDILTVMQATEPAKPSFWLGLFVSFVSILLLAAPLLIFANTSLRNFEGQARHLTMMGTVLIVQLLVTRIGILLSDQLSSVRTVSGSFEFPPPSILYFAIPFAAGAILVRILTRAENALVFSILYATFAGVLFNFNLVFTAVPLAASVLGILLAKNAESRASLMRSGLWIGLVLAALSSMLYLMQNGPEEASISVIVYIVGASVGAGIASILFVFALLPFVESIFGYVTPLRLLELASVNHPAIRELMEKAPGSYQHSVMVGQLVEAGCKAVGADALLGRIGSYFHDIGKTTSPHYFAENQHGVNPHDSLKPRVSAMVIRSHVTDGVKIAKKHRLPNEIIQFIQEHHGTSLIRYFYHQAINDEAGGEVNEADFRYPGPKPQTRETAICLLADGVEASSRTLAHPTPENLEKLISDRFREATADGQLDECDLTQGDLRIIRNAFKERLVTFYHSRPEYPGPKRIKAAKSGSLPPIDPTGTHGAHRPTGSRKRPEPDDAPRPERDDS